MAKVNHLEMLRDIQRGIQSGHSGEVGLDPQADTLGIQWLCSLDLFEIQYSAISKSIEKMRAELKSESPNMLKVALYYTELLQDEERSISTIFQTFLSKLSPKGKETIEQWAVNFEKESEDLGSILMTMSDSQPKLAKKRFLRAISKYESSNFSS